MDIAIPEYKIAIEYDGWYHFNNEESILYFKNRREKIEKHGWKILSYNIFEKFPDKLKIESDINNLI